MEFQSPCLFVALDVPLPTNISALFILFRLLHLVYSSIFWSCIFCCGWTSGASLWLLLWEACVSVLVGGAWTFSLECSPRVQQMVLRCSRIGVTLATCIFNVSGQKSQSLES